MRPHGRGVTAALSPSGRARPTRTTGSPPRRRWPTADGSPTSGSTASPSGPWRWLTCDAATTRRAGQDERIRRLLPLLRGYLAAGGRVVGNFGAANPTRRPMTSSRGCGALGLPGVRLGVIRGDDVLDLVRSRDAELPELGTTVRALGDRIVSANAYIGAEPIVDCLREDAQIVLGGRLADPSLFVGPICHELGWSLDDWEAVGHATLVGHLLECGVHSTGGNFEDPPYRVVPDPHRLGFPLAEVSEDSAVITKLDGTGGAVDERTMKTQLYYEIHDPRTYLTPDVTADFSGVRVEDLGGDRVRLSGATGREWPATLKVLVGVDQGYRATGEISYGGPGCVERARRAEEILRAHLDELLDPGDQVRIDLQGMNSLFGDKRARLPRGGAAATGRSDRVRGAGPRRRPRGRAALLRAGRRRRGRHVRRAGARGHAGLRTPRAGRPRDRGRDLVRPVVKLREIAYSRSGDKGDVSNICVFVDDPADYPLIVDRLTAERVRAHFGGLVEGDVVRYELPNVHGLNFVLDRALGGGVSMTLRVDPHGKSFQSHVLDMEV